MDNTANFVTKLTTAFGYTRSTELGIRKNIERFLYVYLQQAFQLLATCSVREKARLKDAINLCFASHCLKNRRIV